MKKIAIAATAATFSLVDYPSGDPVKREEQIIERAVQLWRKKLRPRDKSKIKN